eukprot:tig00000056_g24074.t1
MVLAAWAHGVTIVVYYHMQGVTGGPAYALEWGRAEETVNRLAGVVSGACMLVIALTSVAIVRRKAFELFFYVHQLFVVAIVFAALHHRSNIWYALPGTALFLLDRGTRFWSGTLRPAALASARLLPGGIVELQICKKGMKCRDPGQFVFLNFPAISRLQWHPFSISSTPADGACTVHIRPRGPGSWTGRLAALVQRDPTSLRVRLEGPYGRPSVPFGRYESVALVAGGIGVAPVLSALGWLTKSPALRRVRMLFVARDSDLADCFAGQIEGLRAAFAANGVDHKLEVHVTRPRGSVEGLPPAPRVICKLKPDCKPDSRHLHLPGRCARLGPEAPIAMPELEEFHVMEPAGAEQLRRAPEEPRPRPAVRSVPLLYPAISGGAGAGAAEPVDTETEFDSSEALSVDVVRGSRPHGSGSGGRPDLAAFFASAAPPPGAKPAALFTCGPRGLVADAHRAARAAGGFHVHSETFHL